MSDPGFVARRLTADVHSRFLERLAAEAKERGAELRVPITYIPTESDSEGMSGLTQAERDAGRFSFEHHGEAHLHSDGTITIRDAINSPAILRGADLYKMRDLVALAILKAGGPA